MDHAEPHDGSPEQFWDTENWQSLCAECHNAKSARWAQQLREARRSRPFAATVQVTVVAGPPGAGKTTWVRERAAWGDLVVDFDALYTALSGLAVYDKPVELMPFVASARDAVLERLSVPSQVKRAWVIQGAAKRADRDRYRQRGAQVVTLAVSPSECLLRIAADPRRRARLEQWKPIVEAWWTEYEPD